MRRAGPYQVEAAIAASACDRLRGRRYGLGGDRRAVRRVAGDVAVAVVELNRAVAISMADGPGAGLAAVEQIVEAGSLEHSHLPACDPRRAALEDGTPRRCCRCLSPRTGARRHRRRVSLPGATARRARGDRGATGLISGRPHPRPTPHRRARRLATIGRPTTRMFRQGRPSRARVGSHDANARRSSRMDAVAVSPTRACTRANARSSRCARRGRPGGGAQHSTGPFHRQCEYRCS